MQVEIRWNSKFSQTEPEPIQLCYLLKAEATHSSKLQLGT